MRVDSSKFIMSKITQKIKRKGRSQSIQIIKIESYQWGKIGGIPTISTWILIFFVKQRIHSIPLLLSILLPIPHNRQGVKLRMSQLWTSHTAWVFWKKYSNSTIKFNIVFRDSNKSNDQVKILKAKPIENSKILVISNGECYEKLS